LFFFFNGDDEHRDLHSFPTRRSSDLRRETRKTNPLVRSIWNGTESDEIRLLSIFRTVRNRCDFPLDRTILSSITPSAMFLSFAADRKSTRLNSSHLVISYAVFCLKKK